MPLTQLTTRRDSFKSTLDADVNSLIRLHERDAGTAGRPGEWMKAIRRSAIVLIAANLENYVEELVCDGLTILANNNVCARDYPEPFRLWIFKRTVNMRNVGIDDAKEYVELSMKLYSDVRPLTLVELPLDKLKESFANPTVKNINWIMSLLGFDNYLTGITIRVDGTDRSAKTIIGELANRRNAVAHGDATQDPTLDRIKMISKFSQLFSTRLRKDVAGKIDNALP